MPARRRQAMAAAALAALGLLAGFAVWSGAVGALYQAALILAAAVAAGAALQMMVRRRIGLRLFKGLGFVATLLLIAECLALIVNGFGYFAPPYVAYRDRGRSMMRDDSQLGFRPDVEDGAIRAVRRRADRSVIYDATYTLRGGLRATEGDPNGPCTVAFMIDSFSFGEGIADADTLANRFSEATGKRLNVVNLGLPAYGPHHVLAWLEHPRFAQIVRPPLAAAYYISIDDHMLRIVGRTEWSRFDPRYALIDGVVTRTGRFHSPPTMTSWRQFRLDFSGFLSASTFYHDLVRPILPDLPERIPAARALYTEALSRADALLRTRHGVPLTILVWHAEELTTPALAELERRGLRILRFQTMVGPLAQEYRIPDDGHPTPLANRRWAEALAREFPGCPRR